MHFRYVAVFGLAILALLGVTQAEEPNVIFLPSANPTSGSVPPPPVYEYPPVASPVAVPAGLAASARPAAVAAAPAAPHTATVVSDPSTGGYRVVISDGNTVTSMPLTVPQQTATATSAATPVSVPAGTTVCSASQGCYVVGGKPRSTSEGGNGWRVIFFVLICATLYLGIGYYINSKKNLKGLAAIPHIEFWSQLPGLAADGVQHTKRWVIASWARGRPMDCFNIDSDLSLGYDRVPMNTVPKSNGKSTATATMGSSSAMGSAVGGNIQMDLGSDEETEYTRAMLSSEGR